MAVDPAYAAWLKTDRLVSLGTVAGAVAKWATLCLDSEIMSPLTTQADADTESTAQAAFLAGPLARDVVEIPGRRRDLLGRLVTITWDRLGYEAGADVFVVGIREHDDKNMTALTVLKRL